MTNRRTRKPSYMDQIMNEPIALPGCPDLIVTRAWAYHWLVRMGHDPKARGFASIDYMVFCRVGTKRELPVDTPLTDLTDPTVMRFLANVERHILGEDYAVAS